MLPMTVKYRDSDKLLFRRVRRVVKAEMVAFEEAPSMWMLTRKNGETLYIPAYGTVIQFGKKVEVLD